MNDNDIYNYYEKEMIVMQDRNYYSIKIIFDREMDWKTIRLIWIAFHKNELNEECFLSKLPKDLIKYVIVLIGNVENDENMASKRSKARLNENSSNERHDKVAAMKEKNKHGQHVLCV